MNPQLTDFPVGVVVVVVVLGIIQLTLDVVALVDLYRRPVDRVALGNKWVWVAIILLVNVLGAIIYLAAGRKPAPAGPVQLAPPSTARTEGIADSLYGRRTPPDPTAPARDERDRCDPGHRPDQGVRREARARRRRPHRRRRLDLRVPRPERRGQDDDAAPDHRAGAPTSGSVQVLGHDVATAGNAVRAEVGFLPDVPGFYDWMTAEDFLRFAGGLFGDQAARCSTSASPCCSTWPA